MHTHYTCPKCVQTYYRKSQIQKQTPIVKGPNPSLSEMLIAPYYPNFPCPFLPDVCASLLTSPALVLYAVLTGLNLKILASCPSL